MSETLTLHVLPFSHPSRAARRALELKGLEFELVELAPGPHSATMRELYGEGNETVPGLLVGHEAVHGSRAIFARLEQLRPDPPLYPTEAVREADRWGDAELQPLGRHLAWGALHFRPELLGRLLGGEQLDPAATDHAIRFIRGAWKYHGISCTVIAEGLAGLPGKIRHIEELIAEGVLDGEQPNAADLQIGSTIDVLLSIGDVRPIVAGTGAERLARRWFTPYEDEMPAGAFPAGWVPATTAPA
jgi:glutathione S-transferase